MSFFSNRGTQYSIKILMVSRSNIQSEFLGFFSWDLTLYSRESEIPPQGVKTSQYGPKVSKLNKMAFWDLRIISSIN